MSELPIDLNPQFRTEQDEDVCDRIEVLVGIERLDVAESHEVRSRCSAIHAQITSPRPYGIIIACGATSTLLGIVHTAKNVSDHRGRNWPCTFPAQFRQRRPGGFLA